MSITKTKPAVNVKMDIDQITFNLKSRMVVIRVATTPEGENRVEHKVRISNIIQWLKDKGYTDAKITGLKTFFKQLKAHAYDVTEEEVIDEVFPDPVEATEPSE